MLRPLSCVFTACASVVFSLQSHPYTEHIRQREADIVVLRDACVNLERGCIDACTTLIQRAESSTGSSHWPRITRANASRECHKLLRMTLVERENLIRNFFAHQATNPVHYLTPEELAEAGVPEPWLTRKMEQDKALQLILDTHALNCRVYHSHSLSYE